MPLSGSRTQSLSLDITTLSRDAGVFGIRQMSGCVVNVDGNRERWVGAMSAEEALGSLVRGGIKDMLRHSEFEYTDDALKAFAAATDIEQVIDRSIAWIGANQVRAFHGTRLSTAEADAMRASGLRPLDIDDRIGWVRAQFPIIDKALTPDLVEKAMIEDSLEHRGNQVHAAISRREMDTLIVRPAWVPAPDFSSNCGPLGLHIVRFCPIICGGMQSG